MPFKLRQLIKCLNQGGIIAYPTETVWGLGCLPQHPLALKRLAQIKQRSLQKGFILVSPNIEYCLPYIDPDFHTLAKQCITLDTSRPTTYLIPKSTQVSPYLHGQFTTIAIRISPHPFIHSLCHALHTPFISTSANLHTRPGLNSALLIQRQLGTQLDAIVSGYPDGSGQASRIIHCQTQQVIRA